MTHAALENLVRIGHLKAEPRNEAESRRLLAMAQTRLADALWMYSSCWAAIYSQNSL